MKKHYSLKYIKSVVFVLFTIILSGCSYSGRIESDGLVEGYLVEGGPLVIGASFGAIILGFLCDFLGVTINHDSVRVNGKRYDIEYVEPSTAYLFKDIIKNRLINYFSYFGPLQPACLVYGIILCITGEINALFETILFFILVICSYSLCSGTEKGKLALKILYWINLLAIIVVIIALIGIICYFIYTTD